MRMRSRVGVLSLVSCLLLALGISVAHAQAREEARLLTASQVLKELHGSPDQAIPDRLLDRAYGIAVVPNVVKAAFFIGGRRGKGVLVVRDREGRFTNPVFISLTGGSFGWQVGVQSTDIVLVFTTRSSIEGITDGKLTLGANASVAAGPVGRQASASTDPTFSSEVYSYSRSRGVFLGVALDGSAISIDKRANALFYGKPGVTAQDIMDGVVTTHSDIVGRFLHTIAVSTGAVKRGPQTAASTPTPATGTGAASADTSPAQAGTSARPQPASTSTAAAPAQGARSFPLADPHPGQAPPR